MDKWREAVFHYCFMLISSSYSFISHVKCKGKMTLWNRHPFKTHKCISLSLSHIHCQRIISCRGRKKRARVRREVSISKEVVEKKECTSVCTVWYLALPSACWLPFFFIFLFLCLLLHRFTMHFLLIFLFLLCACMYLTCSKFSSLFF